MEGRVSTRFYAGNGERLQEGRVHLHPGMADLPWAVPPGSRWCGGARRDTLRGRGHVAARNTVRPSRQVTRAPNLTCRRGE